MDKNYLLKTASHLNAVSESTLIEFKSKSDFMVSEINTRMLNREDISKLVGNNIKMMKDNHSNHSRFIGSIIQYYDFEVLVETVLWVYRAYMSHGFHSNYWAVQLNNWVNILRENLSDKSFNEIYPFYEWMIVNIPLFTILSGNLDNLKSTNIEH